MNAMKRLRQFYGVPAKRGVKIHMEGQPATITSATPDTMRLRVRFDGQTHTSQIHPTWKVTYPEEEQNNG